MSQNQDTTQKMKFFIKSFFSKYDQIRSFLRIYNDIYDNETQKENCRPSPSHTSIVIHPQWVNDR